MLLNNIRKIIFCTMISGFVRETLLSKERHGIGEDWDNQSIQSFGFLDSTSTIRDGQQQDLTAIRELRRHFFRKCSHETLAQRAMHRI